MVAAEESRVRVAWGAKGRQNEVVGFVSSVYALNDSL